ncbi:22556_t:CDS:2, partial [Gigaspora margarita]
LSWWKTCITTPPYLQLLGIKLFSITPHAAGCERIWSICGWMTGKRRANLSVESLESLVKIHSYYITNRKSELNLYNEYDLDDDEGTIWENLNLLEMVDLENNIFKDSTNNQVTENLIDEDELNTFIHDLEDEEDYNPNEIAQKHFDDIDDIYYY